jgi:hypothetical protein
MAQVCVEAEKSTPVELDRDFLDQFRASTSRSRWRSSPRSAYSKRSHR